MSNKALFLDRDGVINIDYGYVHKKEDFHFIDGIFDLVRHANKTDYLVIVITNQAGIGRGFFSEKVFIELTSWMKNIFINHNAWVDEVYYCCSHPQHGIGKYHREDNRRKPSPGMILEAKKQYNINLLKSVLVGDNFTDIDAGSKAGVGTNIFYNHNIKNDNKKSSENFITIKNLFEVKDYLQ